MKMTGNITEEQFKKFCKNFVEKYEGKNFKELIKSLRSDIIAANNGIVENKIKFESLSYGWSFCNENSSPYALFAYENAYRTVFINTFGSPDNSFYSIKELYKFFKMDFKETEELSNVSNVIFNIPIETLKEDYIEFLSKKHNLNKESIELNVIM